MEQNELVSIILPVYGVARYLPECVDSLLAQTYSNLEIILVDDASPDESGAICDAYAARDSRVKVIHQENRGAAGARNAGLDAATGEYVCFVDSDDMVEKDYVNHLLTQLRQGDADIAVCGFIQFSRTQQTLCPTEPAGMYSREEYLLQFLKSWTCALLWNKIFRRQTIGALRMEEGHRIDDEFFTYQVVMEARKIVVFRETLYRYRLRASSVMGSTNARKQLMMDRIDHTLQRYEHIRQRFPDLREQFFTHAMESFARYWKSCGDNPQAQQAIRRWVLRNSLYLMRCRLSLRIKLAYLYRVCRTPSGGRAVPDVPDADIQEYFS